MTPTLLFEYIFALIMAPVAAVFACFVLLLMVLFVSEGWAAVTLWCGGVWQSLKIWFANRRAQR